MMKSKYKAPLLILTATLITVGISSYSNYLTNVRIIERAQKNELRMVSNIIQNALIEEGNSAASKVALVVTRPEVAEAFRAGDRNKLQELVLPMFQIQKNKFEVREAQFNLAPATVFLRLHNLKLFGDDDSSFREMILMSNKKNKPFQGVELGRSGVNIRAIDTVKDNKGIIGTFEIGMSFSTILQSVKKNTNFNSAIFINDDLMTKIATSRPRASQDRIFGDLQGIGATDWSTILPIVNTNMLSKINDITLETRKINEVEYGVILMPLLDFKNSEIGVIVAISDFSQYQLLLKANLISTICFALLQLLILFGVIIITFNVLFLRPVEYINQRMASWRTGNDNEKLNYLTGRDDEIGLLAKNIESLKKVLDDKA